MKIIAITNLFPNKNEPTRGLFNKQQFIELAKLCELKVVAPLPWYSNLKVPEIEMIDGIETYHPRYFMFPRIGRSLYGFFFYFSLLKYVKAIYKNFAFDTVLATWAYPDAFGSYLIAKNLKKSIVIKVHGTDINEYARFFLRRNLIRFSLKRSNYIVAVSVDLAKKIRNLGVNIDKIHCIRNGIDHNIFKPLNKHECKNNLGLFGKKKIILYVGNLKKEKGLEVLLESFSKLCLLRNDLTLIIIGCGNLQESLKLFSAKKGIGAKVLFVGIQPPHRVAEYLNASEVLCLPSFNEGIPNVILESLSCGVPVVACSVGGIPEIITSKSLGILVPPRDSFALFKALNESLSTSWERNDMLLAMENYTWQQSAKQLFALLKQSVDFNS